MPTLTLLISISDAGLIMPERLPFIFCVGFNKSGTTALHRFFVGNGIASVHWDNGILAQTMLTNIRARRRIMEGYDRSYRAFSDMTFVDSRNAIEGNFLFKHMDSDYPGSRFIYNTRCMNDWIRSRRDHVSPEHGSFLRRYMSLLDTHDEKVVIDYWVRQRTRFESLLYEYFQGSDKLLTVGIGIDEDMIKLETFLGCELDFTMWSRHNATDSVTKTTAIWSSA